MSTEKLAFQLSGLANRFEPMLEQAQRDYQDRVPAGYPTISRDASRGNYGIQLDPNFALFLATDGEQLFADFTYRSSRADARSSASREKFSGMPVFDRRPIEHTISDQELRNMLAELLARFNMQPLLIHITDT
ncbi:MAG TPA: hypothetical protein VFP05_08720 [Thermomicrobiales bacterium]|nr:hypothetical protein [Thermomicrobiales bacterium]